jgi:uncharacterized protein
MKPGTTYASTIALWVHELHDPDSITGGFRPMSHRNTAFWRHPLLMLGSLAILVNPVPAEQLTAPGPTFDCRTVPDGSIESLICADPGLAQLDRRLHDVYRAALDKVPADSMANLRAEQRGWIKGRNECWKSDDHKRCVATAYRHRIAELQAGYRLVPASPAVTFVCDDDSSKKAGVSFFNSTEPQMVEVQYDGGRSLMIREPSASGSRYRGRNETFWEHQGEAMITWGHATRPMRCRRLQ